MSVRLFVLGALYEGDAHGYDIIEKGRSWGIESWTDISFSSIYHALRSLARDGLARELSRESEAGRPQRTVYRITPKGRAAFTALMEESAADLSSAKDPVYLTLSFMRLVGAEERAALIGRRARSLAKLIAAARKKLSYLEGLAGGDYWSTESVRLYLRKAEVELEWLRGLSPARQ
jgi:DNA-binding PadR family transcriptional regulator